jgi:predicted DNA-binding transcriptional regulator YafY
MSLSIEHLAVPICWQGPNVTEHCGHLLASTSARLRVMGDPSGRMLHLLSLLQTHRYWPGPELCSRLEVSPRTLRRDVDRLRELGYLVESTRGIEGGYRLSAGADLPPLLLEDEEAVAIGVGLRAAADGSVTGIEDAALRALTKLEQVMPHRLRRRVNDLGSVTVPLPTGGPTVDWSVLTVLAQACRDTVRIAFGYVAFDGAGTERTVEPHRLVSAGRRWYLVAWDIDRRDWRSFRVDRMASTPELLTGFNPRELPAADAATFVAQGIESIGSQVQARLIARGSVDQVRERARWFGGQVSPMGDDECEVVISGESVEWLAACVGLLGVEVTVQEPVELADQVRELAGRLARATV